MRLAQVSAENISADVGGEFDAECAQFEKIPPRRWVETVRRIPTKRGATAPFRFDYAPYTGGMFDAFFEPLNREVVFQLFSRGLKSTTVLNYLGYRIHQDPCELVVGWPTNGQKKKWVKNDFRVGLISATPELAELIPDDSGRRKSRNTLDQMIFPGGSLDAVSFTTPGDMRRTKGEALVGDEIDAVKEHEGDEGDPLKVFSIRASEYEHALEIYCSYPSIRGKSRIEAKLLDSDFRQWFVTCPVCDGEPFIMHRTGRGPFEDGFKRSRLLYEVDRPQEGRLECPCCKGQLTDAHRYAMMRAGHWEATRPFRGRAGFHANSLLWPHPTNLAKYPGGYLQRLAERVLINTCDAKIYHREFDVKPDYSRLYLSRNQLERLVPERMVH